jgi:predicted metalloprotease with PDZ domain
MRYLLTVLICLLLCTQNSSAATADYKVSFQNPNTHYIDVVMTVTGVQKDSFDVKMPIWIPGSYMVREFSRQVEGFHVEDETGNTVRFVKVRKNSWRVYGRKKKCVVHYKVYSFELSVRTSYVDLDEAFINGAATFMYTEETRNSGSTILIEPWNSWKLISTGLPADKSGNAYSRVASGYDRLADSPILLGNHDTINFTLNNIPHQVAMVGKGNYDREKIRSDFYKITSACTDIFKENPNTDYTFFIHNTTSGGGGLEHSNSCSLMAARSAYENEKSYLGLLSLAAHEYFHLWNVKRIRPAVLGPFDYDNEVYTTQLWFFEGFTSFYDDLITRKLNYVSEQGYLDIIKDNIQNLVNTPGDKIQPVAEASFDAWIKYYRPTENSKNSTVSYYTKGALLAMVVNLELLNATNGEKSLDDLMYYLYHEHFKKYNRGLTDQELLNAFNKVSASDFTQFFKKYIYGTQAIPFEKYLAYAGISLIRTDGMKTVPAYIGATISDQSRKFIVTSVERNSPAFEQGLYVNDEVLEANSKKAAELINFLSTVQQGTEIKFKVLRMGQEREVTITAVESPRQEFRMELQPKADTKQLLIRSRWTGNY